MVLGDSGITDAELTALALAADPDQPLADNALPISFYLAQLPNPLPDWYMPAATARHHRWWWPVVLVVVFAFVLVDAFGLCNTFGQLVVA
jgi:hypothetical protein